MLTFGVATAISECSLWLLRSSNLYKPSYVVNGLEQSHYDYVILGSSIGLTTLNSAAIDSVVGLKGINLSMDDTGIGTQCLMLEHFLQQGKTTNYCVLSVSVANLNTRHPRLSVNNYRFLPFIRRDYVSSYFKEFEEFDADIILGSRYFAFFGTAYYNIELFYPALVSGLKPNMRNRFDAMGNYYYPSDPNKNHKTLVFRDVEIQLQNPFLERLKTVCKDNQIELLVYIPPTQGEHIVFSTDDYQVINHSDLLDDSYLFYDRIHVNQAGRLLASDAFANTFKLLTHKEDEQ